jgi:hypothetical protein
MRSSYEFLHAGPNARDWIGIVFLALGLATFCVGARAEGLPSFDLPIACTIGKDCWVQNYVDHAPGPGAMDYTCGHLTYDKLAGTEIRLSDQAAVRRGVPVLAAAPGVVLRWLNSTDAAQVVVGVGEGWETEYTHLLHDSIVVKVGQHVEAGQKLGLVGPAGDTEIPHVNFTVRYKEKAIDPFTGPEDDPACGKAPHSM